MIKPNQHIDGSFDLTGFLNTLLVLACADDNVPQDRYLDCIDQTLADNRKST